MTEHSIEELERQYQAACDRLRKAQAAATEAASRLADARLEATGLAGHKVSYSDRRKGEVFFVVTRESHGNLSGPNIKKDGHYGERTVRYYKSWHGELTDHGPYVEPGS